MRLTQPLLKLPKSFCAETLAAEVRALPASAWLPHPGNYPGNDAVLLVTPEGAETNGFIGRMAATEHLLASRYIRQVMADIGAVWGRSRLMGLGAGANVPPHVDVNYHWRTHIRIHIPIITNPRVLFTVGEESVHMAPGECWVFDSFRMHAVHNGGSEKRVHLVLDTPGGEELWDLIEAAHMNGAGPVVPCHPIADTPPALRFEHVRAHRLMSPWEVRCHLDYLVENLVPGPAADAAVRRLDRFLAGWTALWAEFGDADEGVPAYRHLVAELQRSLMANGTANLPMRNQVPLIRGLTELIFQIALPAASLYPQGQRLAS